MVRDAGHQILLGTQFAVPSAQKRRKLAMNADGTRARFERRLARTAERDAAREERDRRNARFERIREEKAAPGPEHLASGRPLKYASLGVTVHDGMVYKRDARPLGPLVGASAQITDLPDRWRVSAVALLMLLPEKQRFPRVQITVTTAADAVHKEVEGHMLIGQARRQVVRFNELADAAARNIPR
jgi:hypothetical protein